MHNILFETESLCPLCLKKIPACYEEEDGQVYLHKTCPEHGDYRVLFWRDAALYRAFGENAVHAACEKRFPPEDRGCPFDCGLCKQHEGGTCTAVLEITYRCNLTCPVCFADTKKAKYDPSLEEIEALYQMAIDNGGYPSIQLSGGEPTVRDDLPEILRMGKELGFSHIQVNTNGLRLAEEPHYAARLKEAGADLIYLQFDGCNDTIYRTLRGQPLFTTKKQAIANCEKAGLGVLLVPTVSPKVNLDQIGEIVAFAKEHMPIVRGIHYQPMSYFGRFPGEAPLDEERCSLSDVLHALEEQTGGELKIGDFSPRKRYDAHCAVSGLFYLPEKGLLVPIHGEHHAKKAALETDFAKKTNAFTNARWRLPEAASCEDSAMKCFAERLQQYTLAISGMGFQDCWNIDIGRLKGCCVHVISASGQTVPLCAFHLTSATGERLYQNG